MCKKFFFLFILLSALVTYTACGAPDEKIQQAQQKYAELVETHGRAVEAHKEILDNSLDEPLTKLQNRASEMESYNLMEMEEAEIDDLIQQMESLIQSYEEMLESISSIKAEEEASVLVPIEMTITNDTGLSFSALKLYEKGDYNAHMNALEDLEPLAPLQILTGLVMWEDVEGTPWILSLTDTEGAEYELELLTSDYEEKRVSLSLTRDEETGALKISNPHS